MREVLTGSCSIYIAVPPCEKLSRPPGVLRPIGNRRGPSDLQSVGGGSVIGGENNIVERPLQSRREKAGRLFCDIFEIKIFGFIFSIQSFVNFV